MNDTIHVFRYMSTAEKRLLDNGRRIFNTVDWGEVRGKDASTSKGLSFGIGDKQAAIDASRWLKGVADMQWLMIAEVDKGVLTECRGRYPKDYDDFGNAIGTEYRPELCAEEIDVTDGHWHNLQFCRCRAIDSHSRKVVLDNVMVTRNEVRALTLANKIARQERIRLLARDFTTFMRFKLGYYQQGTK